MYHLDLSDPDCTLPPEIIQKLTPATIAKRDRNKWERTRTYTYTEDNDSLLADQEDADWTTQTPQTQTRDTPPHTRHTNARRNPFRDTEEFDSNRFNFQPQLPSITAGDIMINTINSEIHQFLKEPRVQSPPKYAAEWLENNPPKYKNYTIDQPLPEYKLRTDQQLPPSHDLTHSYVQIYHTPLQMKDEAYNYRGELSLSTSRANQTFFLRRGDSHNMLIRPDVIHQPNHYYSFSLRGDNNNGKDDCLIKCDRHKNLLSTFCPFNIEAICENKENNKAAITHVVSNNGHHTVEVTNFHHLIGFNFIPICGNTCFGLPEDTRLRLMRRGYAGIGHIHDDIPVTILKHLPMRTHYDRENPDITTHRSITHDRSRPAIPTPFRQKPFFNTKYVVVTTNPDPTKQPQHPPTPPTTSYLQYTLLR
jgi:hypothetical protein